MSNKRVRVTLHHSQTKSSASMQRARLQDDDLALIQAQAIHLEMGIIIRDSTIREQCAKISLMQSELEHLSSPSVQVQDCLAQESFDQALRSYEAGLFVDAVSSLTKAVQLDYLPSYALLSSILGEGRNCVPRDITRAFKLASAGAALGCADCKGLQGLYYAKGYGVSENAAKGIELGRESAAAGSCHGQFLVGLCHMWGLNVEQDKHEAVRLWRLAAAQGNALAQINLAYMFETGQSVKQDKAEAVRLYRLASQQGVATGQYNLACMLEHGSGVAEDKVEAIKFYQLASEQGHSAAQNNLGAMFENGHGVSVSHDCAVRLYSLAASQGNVVAYRNLLNMLKTSVSGSSSPLQRIAPPPCLMHHCT